jgi:predicted nucleic acid-binding protein
VRVLVDTSVDFLICAVAIAREWPILTTDADFKSYARAVPITIHP